MPMRTLVVIPVKDFDHAKSRLNPLLGPSRRSALARWMCERTLRFFREQMPGQDVLVITASETIALLAAEYGAAVLREACAAGMSAAAHRAAQWSCKHGYASQLLIPADIARLDRTELRQLLSHPRPVPSVLICPSHDRGTNALLTTPPDVLPFCFGERSSELHRATAQRNGIPYALLHLEHLRFDIDTPNDVSILVRQPNDMTSQELVSLCNLKTAQPVAQPGTAPAVEHPAW